MTRTTTRRIILSDEGLEGAGKTHFAFTAPAPIGYAMFDVGHEGVVDKFVDEKAIYGFDYRLQLKPAVGKDAREGEVIEEARDLRARFEAEYRRMLKEFRTVVIDTATEQWGLFRLAAFGRLAKIPPNRYEEVNADYRELLRLAYESSANLLLLHKRKAVWVDNQKTGEYERAGFGDVGYVTQINLLSQSAMIEPGVVQFSKTVLKSRLNPQILGQTFNGITFPELAALAVPGTDEDDWS